MSQLDFFARFTIPDQQLETYLPSTENPTKLLRENKICMLCYCQRLGSPVQTPRWGSITRTMGMFLVVNLYLRVVVLTVTAITVIRLVKLNLSVIHYIPNSIILMSLMQRLIGFTLFLVTYTNIIYWFHWLRYLIACKFRFFAPVLPDIYYFCIHCFSSATTTSR